MKDKKEITFKIEEHYADLGMRKKWKLELNKVSFNNNPAKYDIRAWDEEHQEFSKGITLTEEEMKALKEAITKL